jgi:DegV family protein with EDD domain
MPGVRIVTDSACDLTEDLVKQHDVIVVPLTIRFGDEEFEDRRELSPEEFWRRCQGKGALPETAAPSPGSFIAAFQRAADEGADAVLCLTLSSKLSATYASAVTAAESFTSVPVQVLDTLSVTMGQGLSVIAAAEDAAEGSGLDELVAAAEDRRDRIRVYGVLGGLEFLQRGGRIGGAQALLGSLLSIKPVIVVKDGEVAEESKQRTRTRALAYLAAKVGADAPVERLAVADGACDDITEILLQLAAIPTDHPLVSVQLGPVVGSHTGPNTLGVCYIVPRAV